MKTQINAEGEVSSDLTIVEACKIAKSFAGKAMFEALELKLSKCSESITELSNDVCDGSSVKDGSSVESLIDLAGFCVDHPHA